MIFMNYMELNSWISRLCFMQIITATIHQALGPALEFAKLYATERTAEALHALVDPQESSFVLGVAAGM